ncbi:MAG: fatty acid CoA ligase family protein [Trichloromonadaceae bacterium]
MEPQPELAPEPTISNIAAHLPRMAQLRPHAQAVVFPQGRDASGRVAYTHYTFAQLDIESDRIAQGLQAIGIDRGMRTVLMVQPSLDFFALTFAIFKLGAIPVLVDPGMGLKNLKTCLAEAEPEAFIGIPKAHLARLLLGWGKPTLKKLICVGPKLPLCGTSLQQLRQAAANSSFVITPTTPEETAAILFTSGSTGVPKGVVYSHGNFIAQVEALRWLYRIEPGEIDLPTFPLFALFAPALGMTAIIPDMDATRPAHVDPGKIIEAVENFGVTNMFGSPALLNRIGRYGVEHGIKLPSLRRVISAGAPVPAVVLERFSRMLDASAEIFTPYGATESLPVASIGSKEILGDTRTRTDQGCGVCVGRPVEGLRLEVIGISDQPIPSWSDDLCLPVGEVGEIVVQGPQVTASYFNRAQSTVLAKIADPQTGGFFHRMGDLGYRDPQGRIWFCGRKSHRVITAAGTLFTIPCEAVFNTHPLVFRSALVGLGPPGAQTPVLCVELEAEAKTADQQRLRQELLEIGVKFQHTKGIKTLLFHPAFPVDIRHNAKIFREKLAVWAAGRTA